jgi:hypothetical protein
MAEQACSLALTHIKSDSQLLGFKEGRAWKNMVAKLLILAEKFDLPATIANPTDTSRNLSGFVEFIAEIQRNVKKVHSPHWSPPEEGPALAKAIGRVRSALRNSESLGH